MNNLIIRKAKVTDFEAIVVLAKQLWETEKPFDSNLTDNYYESTEGRESLLKDIKSRKRFFMIAEIDSKVVGFVDGNIIKNDGVYREDVAYLNRIAVLNDYRGLGIGARLIDEFKLVVKENNCGAIKINAFMSNKPAVNLYKKKGFEDYSMFYMMRI